MAQTTPEHAWLLGFRPTGDLGGHTCYTSRRNNTVWFTKSPPLEPPSYHQLVFRNRFRQYAQAWQDLTEQDRQNWEATVQSAGLRLTGYNLFIWYQTYRSPAHLRTLETQTGIKLL